MNRTGLCFVLAVAAVVGIAFGVHAQYDIDISASFFDPVKHNFPIGKEPWETPTRDIARWVIALIVAPAFIAIVGKLVLPRRGMFISGRVAVYLILTLAVGPGLITNSLLKDHWGRMRPTDISEFGGSSHFTPWWDPRGPCPNNCSFVAGEPAGAFWTLAPAALAPPQWRLLTYGGAVVFGSSIGLLRIAAGGHFFTDVVFAGVFMYLVAWTLHGVIFRWRSSHSVEDGEDSTERTLGRCGEVIRRALTTLMSRRGRNTKKHS